jgi:hypothetical protein
MKILSLYIDKWYIVGAINIDGIPRLLCLPNREDRIWLYFHEDTSNDEISYSKEFQRNFRDNENHYYGDVFSQITKSSAKYIMFKRQQDMIGIFKSAKIFDDIRHDIEVEDEIDTYVSFSKDISLAARKMFLDVLAEEKFVVKESVARIGHLALEYAFSKGYITNNGCYLVLNACNENLHYSIYEKSEDLFVRKAEDVLTGLGTDVRSRALIEHVVDNINSRELLLKNREEQEFEYLRMTQYVDNWIVRLSTARSAMPVQLNSITFSVDPHRDYSVSVQRAKIDQRTGRIVEDIVRAITTFVKDKEVSHEQIMGVVFIGDTFTNQQFKREFQKYYNVTDSDVICYSDTELSSLVNVYTHIDCGQFSAETSRVHASAEAELQRQRIAEQDAEERKKAEDEANAIEQQRREETEAERKYNEALQRGYDSEADQDYDTMAEYFNIALSYRPNDEEASNKYNEALRKKAEMSVRLNNYKERIQAAKDALDNSDWDAAKQKAEEALSFMPDSKEASRIKTEAVRRIKQQKEFERYLDRADIFIAQKLYDEATKELDKAKLLDLSNEESIQIRQRESRITSEQGAIEQNIREIKEQLNTAIAENRFDDTILYCDQLVEADFTNSRKWTAKIGEIKAKQEEQKKAEEHFKILQKNIESAQWDEDWAKLAELCELALKIKNDSSLQSKLDRAKEKLAEKNALKELDSSIQEIKDLILDGNFSQARSQLAELDRMSLNTEYKGKIKDLRRLIFQKEEEAEAAKQAKKGSGGGSFFDEGGNNSKKTQKTSRPIGFIQHDSPKADDKFFKTHEKKKQNTTTRKNPATKGDDFFDSIDNKAKQESSKNVSGLTNDDFNF